MSNKLEIRKYTVEFELPKYRQTKLDVDQYLEGVMESKSSTGKKNVIHDIKEVFDAEKIAERKVYKDETGYYFPTRQFKGALINAAKKFKDPQKGQTATQRVKAGVKMCAEKVYLNKDNYTVVSALVPSNGRMGGMIPTSWPEFDDIRLSIPVEILDEFISLEFLKNLTHVALAMYGVGSCRPECGTTSTFSVK